MSEVVENIEPLVEQVRKKGILGVLEERFPRVKGIRERGLLAPPVEKAAPVEEEREIVVEPTWKPLVTGIAYTNKMSVEI